MTKGCKDSQYGATKSRFTGFLTNRDKTCHGFTLLEVMVSLAILATAFAAVLSLHADSVDMVISSRFHSKAAELAQYKMTELELAGLKNIPFMSGEFGDLAPAYTWDINTEPTPVNPWIKVTVTVANRNLPKGGVFQLTEYMLSGPVERLPLE
jgi:prepilin-type N-terminal cleavage/methylation domain-containing protein